MTPLEALVAITAIVAVFGMSGYITVKIIQLIRDWLVSRKHPQGDEVQLRRLDEHEHRIDHLVKRVQNLETIIVDADIGNPELREHRSDFENKPATGETSSDRTLKNKLRT